MKLKKLFACLLAVVALVSTVGCKTDGENSSTNSVTSTRKATDALVWAMLASSLSLQLKVQA